MKFEIEQWIAAPLEAVEAALVDPDFLGRLASLPNLGSPVLLSQEEVAGGPIHQRVRYAFVGQLSGAVRAVVDPERLTWVEDSLIDRTGHRTEFRIEPDHYTGLLRCHGTFVLHPAAKGSCRRVAEGHVEVSVPIVGRRVESAIISGLQQHAEAEVAVLEDWLAGPRRG